MPWFETKETNPDKGKWGQHWTMKNMNPDIKDASGKRQIASHFYPLIDLYASGDSHVVDWQLGLMKLSGVTGVLIDWPGTANVWDYPGNAANCEAIIKGCQRVGLEYAIVYEDHNLGMARDAHMLNVTIIEQGKADMVYLRDKHMVNSVLSHDTTTHIPNLMESNGKLSGVTGVLIDWPGTANVWDYPGNAANCEAIIKGCQRVGL
ncbi:unnamed protein product, partial [Oppiella nova]